MKKVTMMTRLTSSPIIWAASGSYDVARIALPSLLRRMKIVRPIITLKLTPITSSRMTLTLSTPSWMPLRTLTSFSLS